MRRSLAAACLACLCFVSPAFAEGATQDHGADAAHAEPADHGEAADHGATADHGEATGHGEEHAVVASVEHADSGHDDAGHGECDAAIQAKDEMRRRTNPIVATVMVPQPGCPAFIDLAAAEAEAETHQAAAAPKASSGGH